MKLEDVCCYAVLMIAVSTTCVQADEHIKDVLQRNADKRISKREATIFIDSFPIEPIYKHRPQVIYRRISSPRYRNPKPKYGPPRTKYRSSKPSRAPPKKYKKGHPVKYGPPKYKKRPPKPRYGPPKPTIHKPVYGPPKSANKKPIYGPPMKEPHQIYYPAEPVGFGEPPSDYVQDYQSPKTSYGEPPTDSYGTPLKTFSSDIYPPLKSYLDISTNYEQQDDGFEEEFRPWQSYQAVDKPDNKYAYSKKRPTYIKPEPEEVFDAVSAPGEDFNFNSYLDIYKESRSKNKETMREHDLNPYQKNRKPYYNESPKKTKKQWNVARVTPQPDEDDDVDDQVIVGGQYAEPPGRFIPKFIQSAPAYDEEFAPKGFGESDVSTSATMSPYVNYKNSNIAFSPQNLNDAFSIVDK